MFGEFIQANRECAVFERFHPGMSAVVQAVVGVVESERGCESGRREHRELRVFVAMAAIKGVVAGSRKHSACKFVPASAVGLRQLRKVRFPAQLGCPIASKITGSAHGRRRYRRKNGYDDGEEQRKKDDVSNGPMKSINPRKHGCSLLLRLRTGADSDRTANRQSRRRR